ncbi:Cobalt-precorrin 5A hydrolase [hydrothermal vent metagenome]|uniref:Cobalt-precorrin 5A hydrolase n=1 Tax=hydrothermal vent metagenome TaxID=652676 RepID=A0A3B0QU89_9ZZZZ
MKLAIVAITKEGLKVACNIQKKLGGELYAPEKIRTERTTSGRDYKVYSGSTRDLVAGLWGGFDSFIFVMSLGIVTRITKDHIQDKYKDPAIVVVDEMGRYAISALSGHEGGANRLSERVALCCGGEFVVTTGSEATKKIIVGMGCRRNTPVEKLEATLREGLDRVGKTVNDVRLISSVEIKKDEKGLLDLAEKFDIPLKFISTELIKAVEGNFDESPLVKKTLGVGSVAEPCAILGGHRCRIILPRLKKDGTTIAIAEEGSL